MIRMQTQQVLIHIGKVRKQCLKWLERLLEMIIIGYVSFEMENNYAGISFCMELTCYIVYSLYFTLIIFIL